MLPLLFPRSREISSFRWVTPPARGEVESLCSGGNEFVLICVLTEFTLCGDDVCVLVVNCMAIRHASLNLRRCLGSSIEREEQCLW